MNKMLWSVAMGVVLFAALGAFGTATADQKEIAVIWEGKSRMTTNVAMGLLPGLRQLAPDLKVTLYRELKDMPSGRKYFP